MTTDLQQRLKLQPLTEIRGLFEFIFDHLFWVFLPFISYKFCLRNRPDTKHNQALAASYHNIQRVVALFFQ